MAAAAAAGLLLWTLGCASIPGKTAQEQVVTIEELERKTLADLAQQAPGSQAELDRAVGYVIMSNKLTKIPFVGIGAGYGVGVNVGTGERTYLRMRRLDLGLGWGARAVRPVMIFHDEKKFRDYVNGDFDATVGAEASAKVGDKGAAGAGGTGAADSTRKDPGYTSYLITDSGVSATASLAVIRVKRIKIKE